ncbi:MAG: hypothetical protein J0I84_00040 [Terrimonas sp.]|nr:hypothetical protein [Terrimonas sp.]OJY90626.1 MAG: hypothetical protein BGP13_19570 [Sphingobacteriales bacterium 40-81]
MSVRRTNEVFPDEIEFVKVWVLFSRLSRKKFPDTVEVNSTDWHMNVIYSTMRLQKKIREIMKNENIIWCVDEIHVPRKLKHEPDKLIIHD